MAGRPLRSRFVSIAAAAALLAPWPARPQEVRPLPPLPPAQELPPPPPPPAMEPAPFAPPPAKAKLMIGGSSIIFDSRGNGRVRQEGAALGLRVTQRLSPRFATGMTVTWGLTDWDRAAEWIDAGNRAGHWTTSKIEQVASWVREGEDDQALRFIGAIYAEIFLGLTYVAVPVCYVGSLGGATSHVQFDFTGVGFLTQGAVELWVEGGVGAALLPNRIVAWDYSLGPVAGVGFESGGIRVGAKVLWSPGGLNSSARADRQLFTTSLMIGGRY